MMWVLPLFPMHWQRSWNVTILGSSSTFKTQECNLGCLSDQDSIIERGKMKQFYTGVECRFLGILAIKGRLLAQRICIQARRALLAETLKAKRVAKRSVGLSIMCSKRIWREQNSYAKQENGQDKLCTKRERFYPGPRLVSMQTVEALSAK